MSRSWYILHTYTGYENKIERTIKTLIESGDIDGSVVLDVKVPEEKVTEIKNGKETSRMNKFLPGYVMLEMDLPEFGWKDVCARIRKIQGVTGFVGTKPSVRPVPISVDEAKNILLSAGAIGSEKAAHIKHSFSVGEHVKITEGPFASFEGLVKEIFAEKEKLTVEVQIFGRPTPVEVSFLHAVKI